jgi:hypothetical protein
MRACFFMIAIIGLGGCATTIYREPVHHPSSGKCAAAAEQRKQDAAANGYDDSLQKIIFDGAYADCVKWERAHGDLQP